ncbi:MAG: hypothetical protein ACP5M4_15770 [Acidobacteriaceae bacterium]
MICSKCACELPNNAVYCLRCGETLVRVAPSFGEVEDTLRGVGGWLLLFCVGLAIVAPALDVIHAFQNPLLLSLTLLMMIAAYQLFVGVLLWKVAPGALGNLKVYFIAVVVLGVVCLGAGMAVLASPRLSLYSGRFLLDGVRALLSTLLWWLYFHKSRRVRNTYGRNL